MDLTPVDSIVDDSIQVDYWLATYQYSTALYVRVHHVHRFACLLYSIVVMQCTLYYNITSVMYFIVGASVREFACA